MISKLGCLSLATKLTFFLKKEAKCKFGSKGKTFTGRMLA
jgi:hypothetical protein